MGKVAAGDWRMTLGRPGTKSDGTKDVEEMGRESKWRNWSLS